MDFSQIFTDPRNAFAAITAILLGWLHINHGTKIKVVEEGKVDKFFYKKDRELLEQKIENKLDRIEIHIKLLCEKNGIHYQDKR